MGGVMRWLVDSAVKKAGGSTDSDADVSPGSLFASGLIAAGGIAGLIGVAIKGYTTTFLVPNPIHFQLTENPIVSVAAFLALAGSVYYFARKPLK
jgi:hypothetical protein